MKTIQVELYQYSELEEHAKEKAGVWLKEGMDFQFTWENMQNDAERVGIKLIAGGYGESCEGE